MVTREDKKKNDDALASRNDTFSCVEFDIAKFKRIMTSCQKTSDSNSTKECSISTGADQCHSASSYSSESHLVDHMLVSLVGNSQHTAAKPSIDEEQKLKIRSTTKTDDNTRTTVGDVISENCQITNLKHQNLIVPGSSECRENVEIQDWELLAALEWNSSEELEPFASDSRALLVAGGPFITGRKGLSWTELGN